jgi:hypothetical protein
MTGPTGYPKPSVLTVRIFPSQVALSLEKEGGPPPGSDTSEEREEPMSSTPASDDEFPIQDDETVSELVRTPSRASADLQQHADLEDDLEPVLHVKEGALLRGRCLRTHSDE